MKGSKLINILRTFSKEEMMDFEKFAASPYHNTGKNFVPLLKQLQKYHPNFDDGKLTYEYLYSKLYPRKKFNKQVMWNLASAAEKMADEFLIQKSLENSFEKHLFLAQQYSSRKLHKPLQKLLAKTDTYFKDAEISRSFFSNKARLCFYRMESNFLEDKQHLASEKIKERGEYALIYFLFELADIISDLEVNYTMYNFDYFSSILFKFAQELQLEKIVKYAKENNFTYTFILELCSYWIKLILEPENKTHLYNFKKTFFDNEGRFTLFEKYSITAAMVSYCMRKIGEGSKEFRKVVFELDKYRLQNGVAFYPEGQIPKNIYKQMVVNAVMIDEIEWAKEFIKKYTKKLKPEFQKPMESIALAFLHLREKRFELVLQDLRDVEYMDIRDKTHVKILIAQAYYELNQTETLLNHIDSSKHFLQNNDTVNESKKTNYGNFFTILHKIILLIEANDTVSLLLLKKEISALNKLTSKKWLLEKLEELKKVE